MSIENNSNYKIDRIIFGCGRLSSGGIDRKCSIQLLNQAYDLGIRRYDIAPSYGDGDVESVLVDAFGARIRDIQITSKVGLSRPKSSPIKATIKSFVRPMTNAVKGWMDSSLRRKPYQNSIGNMDVEFLKHSFSETLVRLGLDSIDTLLLHEPKSENLNQDVVAFLDEMVRTGKVRQYGTGTGQQADSAIRLGQVMQFKYHDQYNNLQIPSDMEVRMHGFFRQQETNVDESKVFNKIARLLDKESQLNIVYSTRSINRLRNLILEVGG